MVEVRGIEPLSGTLTFSHSTIISGLCPATRATVKSPPPLHHGQDADCFCSVVSLLVTSVHQGVALHRLGSGSLAALGETELGEDCICFRDGRGELVGVCICCFDRLFRRPAGQPPIACENERVPSKPCTPIGRQTNGLPACELIRMADRRYLPARMTHQSARDPIRNSSPAQTACRRIYPR